MFDTFLLYNTKDAYKRFTNLNIREKLSRITLRRSLSARENLFPLIFSLIVRAQPAGNSLLFWL